MSTKQAGTPAHTAHGRRVIRILELLSLVSSPRNEALPLQLVAEGPYHQDGAMTISNCNTSAERRAARQQDIAASKAKEMLDLLLSASQQGIVEHDLSTGVSTYSERWHMMLGFQGEHQLEDTPTLWQELTHPEDLAEVLVEWESHVQFAWPFQRVWRMRHHEGGYRWIECHSTAQMDEAGDVETILSAFADVTERVEEANRQAALLAAIPDTIVRMELDGRVLDMHHGSASSEGLFRDFGKPTDLGAVVRDPRLAQLLLESGRRALAEGCVASATYSTTAVDGSGDGPRHYEIRCAPSGSEQVVLLRDVTEVRMMESQLLQSQKLESIGQLAAGIAHEINTPLQFISDNVQFTGRAAARVLELLQKYSDRLHELVSEDERKELKKEARQAKLPFLLENIPSALSSSADGVARVAEIVAAMKEFSHPGAKVPAPSDINRALKSTVKVSTNEWKGVADLELDLDETLGVVNCVLGEVNQCFLNIIVNAAHALAERYGDTKSGLIRVSTKAQATGVEIRIADNGPGIPEHVRQRIFDPFFTTKPVGKGTGQGLAIARSTIVDRHGGELICESTPGVGTTFVIRLPHSPPGAPDTDETG